MYEITSAWVRSKLDGPQKMLSSYVFQRTLRLSLPLSNDLP